MALPAEIPYEIVLQGTTEGGELRLEDFADFLRDLVFLHDRLWLIASRRSLQSRKLNGSRYYRSKRTVPFDQKLRLNYVRMESPLEIGFTIASAIKAAAVALAYAKAIEILVLLPGKRRKQNLEIQRLEDEREIRKKATETALETIADSSGEGEERRVQQREEEYRWIRRDIGRIPEHGIKITELRIRRKIKLRTD